MTHQKIIEKLSDSAELREGCNRLAGTIYRDLMQDYISMCFVSNMESEEILMLMLEHSNIPEETLREEIRRYIEQDFKDQGVRINGVKYETVQEASEAIGKHAHTIRRWVSIGKAEYI